MAATKVAIVTRAFNRLEYTMKCIRRVRDVTSQNIDYRHMIIENGSTDGTAEWLSWLKKCSPDWFSRLDPYYMDHNWGDWGGMVQAAKRLREADAIARPDYIVQLDNDIWVPENWLDAMVHVMEQEDYSTKVVVLKREGVGIKSMLPGDYSTQFNIHSEFGMIEACPVRAVSACYMVGFDDFLSVMDKMMRCVNLIQLMSTVGLKLMNFPARQMGGYLGQEGSYDRREVDGVWEKFIADGDGIDYSKV